MEISEVVRRTGEKTNTTGVRARDFIERRKHRGQKYSQRPVQEGYISRLRVFSILPTTMTIIQQKKETEIILCFRSDWLLKCVFDGPASNMFASLCINSIYTEPYRIYANTLPLFLDIS